MIAEGNEQATEHLGHFEADPTAAVVLPTLQERVKINRRDRPGRMRPSEELFDAAGPVNRCRRRPRQSVLAGHDP